MPTSLVNQVATAGSRIITDATERGKNTPMMHLANYTMLNIVVGGIHDPCGNHSTAQSVRFDHLIFACIARNLTSHKIIQFFLNPATIVEYRPNLSRLHCIE